MTSSFIIRGLRSCPSVADNPNPVRSSTEQTDKATTADVFNARSSSRRERHGVVRIQPEEYQELTDQHPRARLTYVDNEDGDLITVGSALELMQRLEEPVDGPRSQLPGVEDSYQPMHIFDIRRSRSVLELWREYEYGPSVSPILRPLSPRPVDASELADSLYEASIQGDTFCPSTERNPASPAAMEGSESLLSAFEAEMAKMLNASVPAPETAESSAASPPEISASAPMSESERPSHAVDVLAHAVRHLMDGAQMVRSELSSKLPELEEQLHHVQRALPEQVGTTLQTALTTLEARVGDLTTLLNNTTIFDRLSRSRNVSSNDYAAQSAMEGLSAVASELSDMGRTLFAAFEAEFGRRATATGTAPTSEAVLDQQTSVAVDNGHSTPEPSEAPPIPPKDAIVNSQHDGMTSDERGQVEAGSTASLAVQSVRFSTPTIANEGRDFRDVDLGILPQVSNPAARPSPHSPYDPNPSHYPMPPLPALHVPDASQLMRPYVNNSHPLQHHMPPSAPQMPWHGRPRHSIFASMRDFLPPPPPPFEYGVLRPTSTAAQEEDPVAPPEHQRHPPVEEPSAVLASSAGAGSQAPPEQVVGDRTLFVGNVGYKVTERMIQDVFNAKGFSVDVDLPLDSETEQHAGFGYLVFATPQAARAALEALQGSHIDGHSINLEYSEPPAVEASSAQRTPLVAPVSEFSAYRPLHSTASDAQDGESATILDGRTDGAAFLVRYPALLPEGNEASTVFENTVGSHAGPTTPRLSGNVEISRFPPVSQLEAQMWADRRRSSSTTAALDSRDTETISRQEAPSNIRSVEGNAWQRYSAQPPPHRVPGAFPEEPQGGGRPQDATNSNSFAAHVPHHLRRANTVVSENPAARLSSPFDPALSNRGMQQPSRALRRHASERQGLRHHGHHGHQGHHGYHGQQGRQRSRHWRNSETEPTHQPDNQQSLFAGYRSVVDSLPGAGDILDRNQPRQDAEAAERSASDMSLNPSVRRRQIEVCVATLMDLGYGISVDGGRARITVYAAAADGNLLDAIEMIEEERKVYDQIGQAT